MPRGRVRAAVQAPTRRGVVLVLVHAAAFVAATLLGFAAGERVRPVQSAVLAPAAVVGRRVDWPAHRWVNRVRRRLGTAGALRAVTRALLDDSLDPLDGAGYVGTVPAPAGGHDDADPVARVERRLAARGFRRNPTAYLTYRESPTGPGRDAGPRREYEVGSWALRDRADAPRQLHVLLFDAPDGVDVYAHWEPSVLAGAAHYGRPDYATGVAMATRALDDAGLAVERRRDRPERADSPVRTTPPRR